MVAMRVTLFVRLTTLVLVLLIRTVRTMGRAFRAAQQQPGSVLEPLTPAKGGKTLAPPPAQGTDPAQDYLQVGALNQLIGLEVRASAAALSGSLAGPGRDWATAAKANAEKTAMAKRNATASARRCISGYS